MALAAEGLSNHEIAERLFISPLTAQLVVIAYQPGIGRITLNHAVDSGERASGHLPIARPSGGSSDEPSGRGQASL